VRRDKEDEFEGFFDLFLYQTVKFFGGKNKKVMKKVI
jgi:hypothetical protein